jgi:hypothetical protein
VSEQPIILDNPHAIQAFALLQIYHKLKLEVEKPDGPTWRVSPAKQARQLLVGVGRPNPGRTKKAVFAAYEALLVEEGLLRLDV